MGGGSKSTLSIYWQLAIHSRPHTHCKAYSSSGVQFMVVMVTGVSLRGAVDISTSQSVDRLLSTIWLKVVRWLFELLESVVLVEQG